MSIPTIDKITLNGSDLVIPEQSKLIKIRYHNNGNPLDYDELDNNFELLRINANLLTDSVNYLDTETQASKSAIDDIQKRLLEVEKAVGIAQTLAAPTIYTPFKLATGFNMLVYTSNFPDEADNLVYELSANSDYSDLTASATKTKAQNQESGTVEFRNLIPSTTYYLRAKYTDDDSIFAESPWTEVVVEL